MNVLPVAPRTAKIEQDEDRPTEWRAGGRLATRRQAMRRHVMLRFLAWNTIGVGLLMLAAMGCSGPATVSVQPIDTYPSRQVLGQVTVAVDPLFSKERASADFPGGEAFEEQGLLPVQVMIENGSREAVRAERADFRLVRANGQTEVALSVHDAFAAVKPPVGWWAALPILGPSASAVRNTDWQKQFEARSLKDTPIRPTGSAAGLVYFYFPEADKNLAGSRMVFVLRSESGEERTFDIPLQGRRDIPGQGTRGESAPGMSRPSQPREIPTRVEGAGGGVIIRSPAQ